MVKKEAKKQAKGQIEETLDVHERQLELARSKSNGSDNANDEEIDEETIYTAIENSTTSSSQNKSSSGSSVNDGKLSDAFQYLHSSLLASGKVASKRLVRSDNGTYVLNKALIHSSSSSKGATVTNKIELAQLNSKLYSTTEIAAPPVNKVKAKKGKDFGAPKTAGKGWFDVPEVEIDDDLKRDIQLIEMRGALDPKRFYKNTDKIRHIVGVGTVIEGVGEYKSGRLKNSERRSSITEEVLSDGAVKAFSKRKYLEIQGKRGNTVKTYKDKFGNKRAKKIRSLF